MTHGGPQADGSNVDTNWLVGIDDATDVLAADFEEGSGGTTPGLNHPVRGTTAITNDVWHHAAATYDGSTWNLYLDGALEATLLVGQPTRSDTIQHAALGVMLNSSGTTSNSLARFRGHLDEVRVWNSARSQADIAATMNSEITSDPGGLVARWGLKEGTGTTVADSISPASNGTLSPAATGPTWANGFNYVEPTPNPGPYSVAFNGTSTAIKVPDANALDTATFTVEAWVNRAAGGVTTSTGTGGVVAYPIIAKGRAEAETANADVNYFLGIDAAGRVAGDFEQSGPGTNRPITGTTVIPVGEWHHVAATYDGSTWALYVDGQLDATSPTTAIPANAVNIAPVGIGTAYQTSGAVVAANGAFSGSIDEARIWSVARSAAEIEASFDQEISTATAGLVARWGMNEDSGAAVPDSVGTNNGVLSNGTRVAGFVVPVVPGVLEALDLGTAGAYATFGDPSKLDLAAFTVETWFRRDDEGVAGTTGSGGITDFIPLVTHGAPEADNSAVDANWVLGISNGSDVLAADFEEAATGGTPGLNHPVYGVTPITDDVWHHAAATYDGTTWKLYLDGNLERTLVVGQPVRSDSTQHAALGAMLLSSGTPANTARFHGALDEARVWNSALSPAQIQANVNSELTTGTGLVARWGLDDSTGTTVADSIAPAANGTIQGSGSTWIEGAPFDIVVVPTSDPNVPTLVSPADGAIGVASPPKLEVAVSDPDGGQLTTTFYGREVGTPPGDDFTFVVIPDTQHYVDSADRAGYYTQQTQWIADNAAGLNIAFVSHLGDVTESFDSSRGRVAARRRGDGHPRQCRDPEQPRARQPRPGCGVERPRPSSTSTSPHRATTFLRTRGTGAGSARSRGRPTT